LMQRAANVGIGDHRIFGHLYSPVSRMCVRIPAYPPPHSDSIRPLVPGYPPTCDALL